LNNFNMIGRDFEIVGINLKGKAKTPTLSLESENGEKLTVMLSDRSFLAQFKTGMEFRMKLYPGEQETLPFTSTPEPTVTAKPVEQPDPDDNQVFIEQVPESSATIPEGECPKGVDKDDYGTSEVCDDCPHLVREGDPELGMGAVVCNLDPKPEKEPVQEAVVEAAP
jgi:hypothetical protein